MPCGTGHCGIGWDVYPDLDFEMTTTETLVLGVTTAKPQFEGAEFRVAADENGGCKCGSNCTCEPCNCK